MAVWPRAVTAFPDNVLASVVPRRWRPSAATPARRATPATQRLRARLRLLRCGAPARKAPATTSAPMRSSVFNDYTEVPASTPATSATITR
jgi:hypothetical protein